MTGQLELWTPGWEVEPCGHSDPDPDEQAFTDLHGRQPQPRAYRTTVTVPISIDYYQPEETPDA